MTIFSRHSGRLFGTHQKIDRAARKNLGVLLGSRHTIFPGTKKILHFEGLNGPDGLKRKSPAKDEPWHYINPFDKNDIGVMTIIADHYQGLVNALRDKNEARAAFEAAWLSHAIVDGLTPAHHYPYEEKLSELRGGEGLETRTTIRKKLIMPGVSRHQQISNNWKMWGPRGLYTSHMSFEMGIAALITPMTFNNVLPDKSQIAELHEMGVDKWFQQLAKEVAALDLFEKFVKSGWSAGLARKVHGRLLPVLVRSIIIAWYSAIEDAELAKAKK